ncbi:hypothetical protein VNO80_01257 [Phaseolus coccineus]|uniref:Uncharacterized protein n=1 Tax=Phaseolus coccineus TaxID=3886 RepID=A0AAN9RSJ7_PHACN
MSHGNSRSRSKSNRSRSKSSSRSRKARSVSRKRESPSPSRKIRSYRAAVDDCIETSISLTDTRNKERTKTPSRRPGPSRSRSKSSTHSKRKGSKSPKAKTASPRRHGSEKALGYYRYRRSQERRTSPCQRRKSTERPLHSPSQKRSGNCNQTKVTKLLLPGEC